jgi:hypothetical protein
MRARDTYPLAILENSSRRKAQNHAAEITAINGLSFYVSLLKYSAN